MMIDMPAGTQLEMIERSNGIVMCTAGTIRNLSKLQDTESKVQLEDQTKGSIRTSK